MPLSDEQIARLEGHAQYFLLRNQEEREQNRIAWASAHMPSQLIPYFSIKDYEKARRGQSVPIEPRPSVPLPKRHITDNRSLSQYLADVKRVSSPSSPNSIKDYLEQVGEPSPLLANP
jgi:hypothetical protein